MSRQKRRRDRSHHEPRQQEGQSAPPDVVQDDVDEDDRSLAELLRDDPELRQDFQRITAYYYSGPTPHPEIIAAYNEVSPGTGDMILEQWRLQGEHRMDLERTVVKGDNHRAYIGTGAGVLFIGAGLLASWDLGRQGHEIAAAGVIGSVVILLSSGLIYISRSRQQEREKKFELMRQDEQSLTNRR